MLIIKTGWNSSQVSITLDGVDMTALLCVERVEVEPITPNEPVRVRLTLMPDQLEVSALPEWVQVKIAEARDAVQQAE